jgi:hypothetical protein
MPYPFLATPPPNAMHAQHAKVSLSTFNNHAKPKCYPAKQHTTHLSDLIA